jgi:hypothetical protein
MPLVDDVISQLGKSAWFFALDLQLGFWQIRMAPEDVKKTAMITKTGLYDWTVMPVDLKNATSTFTKTMSSILKEMGDILTSTVRIGGTTCNTWVLCYPGPGK